MNETCAWWFFLHQSAFDLFRHFFFFTCMIILNIGGLIRLFSSHLYHFRISCPVLFPGFSLQVELPWRLLTLNELLLLLFVIFFCSRDRLFLICFSICFSIFLPHRVYPKHDIVLSFIGTRTLKCGVLWLIKVFIALPQIILQTRRLMPIASAWRIMASRENILYFDTNSCYNFDLWKWTCFHSPPFFSHTRVSVNWADLKALDLPL